MRTVSFFNSIVDNESTSSSTNRCRRIILMGIDMYETDNDSYFWNSVRALSDLGHNIIIVRNRGISKREVRQIHFPHMKIGTWIPRTICGCFRSFMYVIRSAYTAMWVARNLRGTMAEFEPTLVVSDASSIAVPILHRIGKFQVICLEYFRELLAEFQPFRQENSMMDRLVGPIRRRCLVPAELLLVPCQNARQLMDTETEFDEDERLSVMYPPAEGEHSVRYEGYEGVRQRPGHGPAPGPAQYRHLQRRRYRTHPMQPLEHPMPGRGFYTFLAVGMYEPESNFHVLIGAFQTLVTSLDVVQQQRMYMTVAGSWSTATQRAYLHALEYQVAAYPAHVAAHVTLHANLTFEERCILYRRSSAVLNANVEGLYVPSIIEAYYFGRLVITAHSEFVDEVLQDAVTGFVVPELDAEAFARAIFEILQPDGPAYRFMALAAAFQYDDVYSFQIFTARFQHALASLSDGNGNGYGNENENENENDNDDNGNGNDDSDTDSDDL